jgi:hypothetical protein
MEGSLPQSVVPRKKSVRRREIYSAMCKAYVGIEVPRKAETWCDEVLGMEGGDNDLEALKGKGEACLAKEEWEEGTRYLERAFEASGRSSQDVRRAIVFHMTFPLTRALRSILDCKRRSDYSNRARRRIITRCSVSLGTPTSGQSRRPSESCLPYQSSWR